MKNIVAEMKNTLEEINSRVNDTEEWINELEYRVCKSLMLKRQKKSMKRNDDSLMRTSGTSSGTLIFAL